MNRRAANSAAALVLAVLLGVLPAAAQTQTGCASALSQALQGIAKQRLSLNDAYIQLAASRANAIRDTCYQPGQPQNPTCITGINNTYDKLKANLDDVGTNLDALAAQARNNFGANPCPWTEQEIAQMVATIGQAVSQVTQSIAQVVTAAKSGSSTSSTAKGEKPSPAPGAASPAAPAKPASPPGQTTPPS